MKKFLLVQLCLFEGKRLRGPKEVSIGIFSSHNKGQEQNLGVSWFGVSGPMDAPWVPEVVFRASAGEESSEEHTSCCSLLPPFNASLNTLSAQTQPAQQILVSVYLAAFDSATRTTQIAEICLPIGSQISPANEKTELSDRTCSGCQIERDL